MSPDERRTLYFRGFGDGAKVSAIKHPDDRDYLAGWRAGNAACTDATLAYADLHGLPRPRVLHLQDDTK